jgi:hypothetical protein
MAAVYADNPEFAVILWAASDATTTGCMQELDEPA